MHLPNSATIMVYLSLSFYFFIQHLFIEHGEQYKVPSLKEL